MNAVAKVRQVKQLSPIGRIEALKGLTLAEAAADESQDLWFVNVTDQMSRHLIDITANGKSEVLVFRNTWIPDNMSSQFQKADILKSSDFRRAVNGSQADGIDPVIKLITEEQKNEILGWEEAKIEIERIRADKADRVRAQNSVEVDDAEAVATGTRAQKTVRILVQKTNKNKMSPEEALSALKVMSRESTLKVIDLEHVVNECENGKIKAWAATRLGV